MFYKVFDAHALTFVMTLAIPKPLPPTMLFVVLAGQRLKPIWEELQKHTALHYYQANCENCAKKFFCLFCHKNLLLFLSNNLLLFSSQPE